MKKLEEDTKTKKQQIEQAIHRKEAMEANKKQDGAAGIN